MDNQLWNVFRETGEPVGYLLYKMQRKQPLESHGIRRSETGEPVRRGKSEIRNAQAEI